MDRRSSGAVSEAAGIGTTMDKAIPRRMPHPNGLAPRVVAPLALPLHQVRRALREPRRLRHLHYSAVLASLRSILEPDERGFLEGWLGVGRAVLDRFEADLLDDHDFARAIEARHRDVR